MMLTEALRQDHETLRTKAALLESTLSTAPYARLVFREKCFSLMRLLNRHMKREELLVHLYYQRFPSARYLPRQKDHTEEHDHLRAVTELLLGGLKVSIPLLILRVSQALEQLQERMDEQEQTLFPLFEDVTPAEAAGRSRAQRGGSAISGSMSLNAILQRYPQAETVFAPLHINRLREGYDSVEELAWRRGMDVAELLEQVRQAVASFPAFSGAYSKHHN